MGEQSPQAVGERRDLSSSVRGRPPFAGGRATRLSAALVLLMAMLAVVVGNSAAVSSQAAPADVLAGPIGHDGRWLTDPEGRVVMLDGVNFVDKVGSTPAGLGFGDDDATWLADNGIDVVRLGFNASAAMPTAGNLDETYIDSFVQTVQLLESHGILVLVDLHQDGWGPTLGSDGFPGWMTLTHGATNTHTGFPLYYVTNPAIQAAFDSFWADEDGPDGVPLQTDVARIFADVASKLKNDNDILGYDLINEPWPGTVWNDCEADAAGCPSEDHAELDAYYARMASAIRGAGDHHLLFGEPWVLFNFGKAATSIELPGKDANSGMAFHMYTTSPADEPGVIDNALAWTRSNGGALLASEFGASQSTSDLDRQITEFDHALIPWIFWSYDGELMANMSLPAGGSNVVASTADAVIRPHPVLVAGTPTSLDYDQPDQVLRFSWSTTSVAGQAFPAGTETTFNVASRTYPNGYKVLVTGGTVTSAPNAEQLTVVADPGAKSVSVTVWDATEATAPTTTTTTTTTAPPSTTTTTTTAPATTTTVPPAPAAQPVSAAATFTG